LKSVGVTFACLLRENLEDEVAAFRADVWQDEPVFLDKDLVFYHAIAGGSANAWTVEQWKEYSASADPTIVAQRHSIRERAAGFMTPEHHNMVGQGLTLGGVYVVRAGGAVEWAHHENVVGSTSESVELLAAAQRAAGVLESRI